MLTYSVSEVTNNILTCEVLTLATAYYEIKPEDLLEARTSGHSTELRYYDDESHVSA